jgi:hypothetical protein
VTYHSTGRRWPKIQVENVLTHSMLDDNMKNGHGCTAFVEQHNMNDLSAAVDGLSTDQFHNVASYLAQSTGAEHHFAALLDTRTRALQAAFDLDVALRRCDECFAGIANTVEAAAVDVDTTGPLTMVGPTPLTHYITNAVARELTTAALQWMQSLREAVDGKAAAFAWRCKDCSRQLDQLRRAMLQQCDQTAQLHWDIVSECAPRRVSEHPEFDRLRETMAGLKETQKQAFEKRRQIALLDKAGLAQLDRCALILVPLLQQQRAEHSASPPP